MDAQQILKSDINDIIFEGRNKAYGAYDIRKKYRDRVNLSLLIAISFVVLVLLYPEIVKLLSGPAHVQKEVVHETTVNELAPPPPMEKTTPPPPELPPPPPKKLVFTPPKVVKEKVEDQPLPDIKTIEKTPVISNTTTTSTNLNFEPPKEELKVVKQPEPEKIYETFDEQPEPPGGAEGYAKFLADHIKYPAQAMDAGVQGTVYIQLVVSKTGEVSDVKIKKDPVGYGCGEEAVRVIKSMPPWKPGKMNGVPVNVRYVIPVKFVLH